MGRKVINRLAADLQKAFPEMKGFSLRNLKYMRAFAEAYPDEQLVQQAAALIPWFHNCVLLDKVKDSSEREWYIQQTIQHGWSRNILVHQIESKLYHRQGKATTNFNHTLPQAQSELAQQLLKDPYTFDFLNLGEDFLERDLERALINHIRDFLLELGVGFGYLGSQYHLEVGGEDFYIDLLFYHARLHCYIVIDLKIEEFKPEYSGKMNFYVSAVDDLLRQPDDQPTIGMILCKSKNKVIAEYSLRDMHKSIGVSVYQLKNTLPEALQGNLPTIEQLEAELETVSIIEKINGLSGSEGKMEVTHYPLDEAYKRLRLQTKRIEFTPEEIGNEVAKIRSEINANTTEDSDLI
ncbi:PDDEXK nuclease domain-containing protein [Nostoc sp. 'Peltigera malacea cyanobiont' DB3992]|uniref:PDDEXK nuclease domain-containing protein n=1 Tax=Nostoc sp. 'Peltigera malacea cyanobiont' DB3992 TaxID=1206980 RepID=UPI00211E83D0|nr:PDDEXK nuclease domain-containing protein [Nostoc sp. 'Peltigera malacea cyanobiont' DB3992]